MSRARDLADSADLNFDDGTLVIDSGNNRVGVNESSPTFDFHVVGQTLATRSDASNNCYIEGTPNANLNLKPLTAGALGQIIFRDSGNNAVVSLRGNTTDDALEIQVNGSERMRIDSSGNLLVGTTDTNPTNDSDDTFAFVVNKDNHEVRIRSHDLNSLEINRTGTDGSMATFSKNGSTVGSIGANSSQVYLAGTGAGLKCGTGNLRPTNGSGATTDNAVSLGSSSFRFTDLYLSGGVYLGGTGSANYLDDYEEGTWTPAVVTGTSTTSGGNYVKVGRIVFIQGEIDSVSDTSSTNNVTVSGLPFQVIAGIGFNGGLYGERVDSALQHAKVRIIGNTTSLDFIDGVGSSDFASFIRHNNINDGSDVSLRFTAFYFTDN